MLGEEVNRKISRASAVELLEKLHKIGVAELNDGMQEQLKGIMEKYKAVFKHESMAYGYLCERWGLTFETTGMELVVAPEPTLDPDMPQDIVAMSRDLSYDALKNKIKEMETLRAQ